MLTELKFEDNGKARIDLVDGTTMSVITPERRRKVDAGLDPLLNAVASLLGLPDESDPRPIPDHLVEVCFVHPVESRHLPEVLVLEWQNNMKDPKYSGGWTIYHVTEQQVLDYANKVGVK